jgi:glycosyltransferase involved in cell wall biosynthesis
MRKVLLVAYSYPPGPLIGALRPAGLAKYLPGFGWEVVVVTAKLPGHKRSADGVIETDFQDRLTNWKRKFGLDPSQGLHQQIGLPLATGRKTSLPHTRIIGLAKSILTFPDPTTGWIPFATKAVQEFEGVHEVDAIISTSPPITCALLGRRLKTLLGKPWIADFRDLWADRISKSRLKPLQAQIEKRALAHADALVTVSDEWAARLHRRYGDKPAFSIPNGYDPDDFAQPSPPLTEQFTITHTGRLYAGHRDPTPLLRAIRELIDEGRLPANKLCLRFYGPLEPWLPPVVRNWKLEDLTEVRDSVPREQALKLQRESQVLLLLGWDDPRETGWHTGKLYEYLGSKRPILAVGGAPGALTQVLRQTKAGVHVQSDRELKDFMLAAYAEFAANGRVSYREEANAVAQYTHREMARKFAAVLDSTLAGCSKK